MSKLMTMTIVGLIGLTLTVGCRKTTTVEGTGGKKLSVTKPTSLTITQGATEQIKVTISRTNFTDPVEVKFDKLPPGLTVVETTTKIAPSDASAVFTFKADDTAPVVSNVDAVVNVTGPGDLKSSETFPITITKKS
jgi:hypothetical protein